MNRLGLIIGIAVAGIFVCVAAPVIMFGAIASACAPTPATVSGSAPASPASTNNWDAEQISNAKTIVTIGVQRQIPARGHIIALATAMQESHLRNLPHLGENNDHDSIGLFQQRPSQGWGTPQQLADPTYQTAKFYEKLVTIDHWQEIPIWQAAQHVQRSAYPNAYQKWEDDATQLRFLLTGESELCAPVGAGGWMMPVNGLINSGFRTASRPSHDGIDIGAPKGTPIRAAATAVVIKVACNASLSGQPYSCDKDGSPSVAGCGWFAELRTGPIVHRYCHMLVKPNVVVGQQVVAGQIIGVVGTSGNSSGPHLHWEIHQTDGGPATHENAIDPEAFLRSIGVTTRPA